MAAGRTAPRRLRAALATPLPFRYSGKVVAVVQAVTLLAVLAMDLVGVSDIAPALSPVLLALSLAALFWSFGRDVRWQLRSSR